MPKKIWQWLTGNVIKEVGDVIDKLTTTKEEKLEAQRLLTEILEKADKEAQEQVTERWKADMSSDSKLSKNIRPMVLIYLTVIFTACAFFDGNIGSFNITDAYVKLLGEWGMLIMSFYFGGRSVEKVMDKINLKRDKREKK